MKYNGRDVDGENRVRSDAMPLPVKFQSDPPRSQELRFGNGVEKVGQILLAASQWFCGSLLEEFP